MPRQRERLLLKCYLSGIEELAPCVKPSTIGNNQKMVAQLPQHSGWDSSQRASEQALSAAGRAHFSPHWTAYRDGNAASLPVGGAAFWEWAIGKGYAKMNPWMKVRRVGKANVGKPQLRIDETRKLEAVAMQRARSGDVPASVCC